MWILHGLVLLVTYLVCIYIQTPRLIISSSGASVHHALPPWLATFEPPPQSYVSHVYPSIVVMPHMYSFTEESSPPVFLTTHLTLNRFSRLRRLVNTWKGPFSASIAVCTATDLASLDELLRTFSSPFSYHIHVVIVCDSEGYPANLLRNVALDEVPLKDTWSIIVDVDAVLYNLSPSSFPLNHVRKQILSLPAFQLNGPLPKTLSQSTLRAMYANSSATSMHFPKVKSYVGGFDVQTWFRGGEGETSYHVMYEPYCIVYNWPAMHLPFDERLRGFGFNKQAWHFKVWAAGYELSSGSLRGFVVDEPFVEGETREGKEELVQKGGNKGGRTPHRKQATSISRSVAKNIPLWHLIRQEIIDKYQLRCRSWFLCEDRGRGCDRVCSRASQGGKPRVVRSKPKVAPHHVPKHGHKHAPPSKHQAPHTWTSFKKRYNLKASLEGTLNHPKAMERCSQVDVVYTFVNGSVASHILSRQQHIPAASFEQAVDIGEGQVMSDNHGLDFRFRDFNKASTLKYSLRALLKHAPWVRKVFIVVANLEHTPSFLNTLNTRVQVVTHASIFRSPAQDLPTFNSCAIEVNIHRIQGLSECYLYMNDDVFLDKDLSLDELWAPHAPFPSIYFNAVKAPRVGRDIWEKKLARVARSLRIKGRVAWEDLFLVGHHAHFFLKSYVDEIEAKVLAQEFKQTSNQKWRSVDSLWVPFAYNNLFLKEFPTTVHKMDTIYHRLTRFSSSQQDIDHLFELMDTKKHAYVCINDLKESFEEDLEERLYEAFEKRFPHKSEFER